MNQRELWWTYLLLKEYVNFMPIVSIQVHFDLLILFFSLFPIDLRARNQL